MLIVADGAGGRSGAAQAAEFMIRCTRDAAADLSGPDDCFRLLYQVDQRIAQAADCGETTGVIVVASSNGLFGGSVGDSAAWLFTPDSKEELTRMRKPYLGTGVVAPHQFARPFSQGTVVVASDGLWKYTSLELIEEKVRMGKREQLAAELGELVRLRSGTFPDDVSIATCRIE